MPNPGKLRGREQEVLALHKQGLSEYKIAVKLDVYPNSIRALLKRLAKQSAPQSVSPQER